MPVKLGFIILSLIGVLRIPEEFYLYKDKDIDKDETFTHVHIGRTSDVMKPSHMYTLAEQVM